jgi:hypothetical protein
LHFRVHLTTSSGALHQIVHMGACSGAKQGSRGTVRDANSEHRKRKEQVMKHLKLTFVGLLAQPAAAPHAFAFGPPGPPPMGGGLPAPPMGGRSSVRPNIGVRSAGRARKDAKSSIQHAMMAAIFLVAGTSSAAFGDETSGGVTVLRGTPARVEQPQKPQGSTRAAAAILSRGLLLLASHRLLLPASRPLEPDTLRSIALYSTY